MIFRLITAVFIATALLSCKKSDENSDLNNANLLDYQKELNHQWTPVITSRALTSSSMIYVAPLDCERDNIYTFNFDNPLTMHLYRSERLCADAPQSFESIFGDKNNIPWTYNSELKSLVIEKDPFEVGYRIKIDDNILTLTYYYSNPAAFYAPRSYQFKKVGTSCNDCLW